MTKKKKQPVEADTPLLVPLEEAEVLLQVVPTDQFPPDSELGGPAPSHQFVADIQRRGQIYPIIAVKNGKTGGYLVRDGRNRIKAARILRCASLRTLVFSNIGDYEAMTITTAANAHRRSNPIADLEVLRCLEQDGKPLSWSGLPASTIRKLRILGKLEPQFMAAIKNGQMSVATAEALVKLETRQRKPLLNKAVKGERITSAEVADAKRVQTAGKAAQFGDLLNEVFAPEIEQYAVVDPNLHEVSGYANQLNDAREMVQALGVNYKVYRLIEV